MRTKRIAGAFAYAAMALLDRSGARAESWPTLEQFASECVLVVKARQVGDFREEDGAILSFEVTETWKGIYDPRDFTDTTREGYLRAAQGEHGVEVAAGQEIVFFFSHHNQPEGLLARHNAAFPIRDGKVIYASTGHTGIRRELTVEEFETVVAASGARR